MEPSAHQRFLTSNIVWPPGDRFFLPDGGLIRFLRENIRFKVFLMVMPVFTNAYCNEHVASLPAPELCDLRIRMKELVRHMFFAAQIRQNEFRISYDPVPVPNEVAWMFHVILCLLRVIGFEDNTDTSLKTDQPFQTGVTEGQLAEAQAKFLLGTALQTYVDNMYDEYGWVNKNFVHCIRPDAFKAMPVGIPFQELLELEDILSAWQAHYCAEGPKKSPGSFPLSKEAEVIVRQEREEEEMTHAAIVASTVQSIAAETREATGWVTMEELDRPLDEYFNRPFTETARFPHRDGIQVTLLTLQCCQESSGSFDEGYYSGDEDKVHMAAVYAVQKARRAALSHSSMPELLTPSDSGLSEQFFMTSICVEGGLETSMPRISESSLVLIRSYLQYVLVVLRTVGQRTFAEQISAVYNCDLSQQLPATAFNFPPCGASMINILVKMTDRVKLPDPVDQAVLVPMLQMLRVIAYTWARNQQSETEWSPYSAQTGLFCDASISIYDYFGEVDSADSRQKARPESNMGKPMKFCRGPVTVSRRYAGREKFRNLDFRTAKCVREYANLPSLVRLTREHLDPMAQYFCYIQANFYWTAAAHSSQDMTVMRQVIVDYLVHVAHLADMLVRYREVADARHLPVPRIPTLCTVMRAQRTFGFKGDEDKGMGRLAKPGVGLLRGLVVYSEPHVIDGELYFLLVQHFDMIARFPTFNGNPGTFTGPPIVPFYFDRGGHPSLGSSVNSGTLAGRNEGSLGVRDGASRGRDVVKR
ncbi:hypothetical protein C8J57DRAFT_1227001 [Mycena rebaudengoi]|nr:hypothetical protein C8J57DRAFT_1227001 [Mycena rebaudengoi]